MPIDPLSTLFEAGKMAIERIWPDPNKRAEEVRKLEELRQEGDIATMNSQVQVLLGQIEINKIEASKDGFFTKWRPGIGWVGVVSLALMYIPKAIMLTIMWSWQCIILLSGGTPPQILPPFPDLGVMDVIGIIAPMLGIGVMRSFDKVKGTETNASGKI